MCAGETRLPLPIAPKRTTGPDPFDDASSYKLLGSVTALIDSRIVAVDGATVRNILADDRPKPDSTPVPTDNDGRYQIDGLTPGVVSVEVSHERCKTTTASVMLSWTTSQLDFVLVPAERPVQRIAVGETVRSRVSADDPYCATLPPLEAYPKSPCKIFEITSSRTGTLMVNLVWASSTDVLQLLMPSLGATCCLSPLRSHFAAVRGVTYTFSVGFEGTAGDKPTGTVPFELTTSLGLCQMTYRNWDCSTGRE